MNKLNSFYDAYLEHLRNKGMTAKTIREHSRFLYGAIQKGLGHKNIDQLNLNDSAFVEHYGELNGKWGPQRALVVFRRLLRYIHREGYTLPFYWRDIEIPNIPPPPVEYLDKKELDLLRNSIPLKDRLNAGLRTRTILELIIATGVRISEACSLDIDDIDFENKELSVVNCKSGLTQRLYLTEESIKWLKLYLQMRKDNLPCLFVSGRGRLLAVTSKTYLNAMVKKLGIKRRIYHHLFRKTYVTNLVRNTDIKTAQHLARHVDPRTTLNHYTATDTGRAKTEHDRIMNSV